MILCRNYLAIIRVIFLFEWIVAILAFASMPYPQGTVLGITNVMLSFFIIVLGSTEADL